MEKQVITVAKGQFILDVLEQMGKQVKSAWIFLDISVVEDLYEKAQAHEGNIPLAELLSPEKPRDFSVRDLGFKWKTNVAGATPGCAWLWLCGRIGITENGLPGWYELKENSVPEIAFWRPATDPDQIYFFTMEK